MNNKSCESTDKASSARLSLIVPTYNERESLPILVERVHHALDGYQYELIVVDDDSPDGTAELAENLSHEYPIRVVCRKGERGLATAVVGGFAHASGQVLGVIDADLQHPPEMLPELLREIDNGADVAVGSRYIPGGGMEGWSFPRRFMSKVATMIARTFVPSIRKVKDPMSGFFLFRREVIDGTELKPVGYKILLEVLARGRTSRVAEVPYTFRERELGESKLDFGEQISYLKHVLKLSSGDRDIRRIFQFGLVGISGGGVNVGILWILTAVLGLPYYVSSVFSIEASILSNFILNDFWTFQDRRDGRAINRILKYHVVAAVGAVITYVVYISITALLGEEHYVIAMPPAIVAGFTWNLLMSLLWTWRKSDTEDVASPL
jgi:dolichol-phosphate mannosyltransferase